ncbi:MAG: hypothetical protein HQ596_05800 [Candidatus Saganbacteria bacterium]|nr:hypothetical protein [Candidatus Saganbacteria bacterium]
MALIKKDQIEDKGTLVIERQAVAPLLRPALIKPKIGKAILKNDLPRAKNEAQKIIDAAMNEASSIREEAKQAGREAGRSEAASQIEEAVETLNQAVKERKNIIKDSEQEILRLAIKVAEQVIRSEVSLHRDVCLNIVAEAISRVSDREQIIVKVNREDAEYLKRYKDRLAGMLDGVKSFSVIEDPNIEPGGCLIETNLGFVDAKISTKIQSIEESLNKISSEEATS